MTYPAIGKITTYIILVIPKSCYWITFLVEKINTIDILQAFCKNTINVIVLFIFSIDSFASKTYPIFIE